MAQPEYVPRSPAEKPRVYESPPRRPSSWLATRPAELRTRQPLGPRLGYPGPDQGFVLKLAERYKGQLVLTPGESEDDALAGCAAVALKRASLFGRAPVIHDLVVALAIWGFLGPADPELVRLRKPLFEGVSHPHHYMALRKIADLVPQAVLKQPHQVILRQSEQDWRQFFQRRVPAVATTATSVATKPTPTPKPSGADTDPSASHDAPSAAVATGIRPANDEVPPQQRTPAPRKQVRTQDVTELVAQAKEALLKRQMGQR
ncbi:MAG: hypothetical protein N2037_04870 [Acidimicrobiales bacterium]|nr:hypothetical protein [Acidimicrobiales bacterium]